MKLSSIILSSLLFVALISCTDKGTVNQNSSLTETDSSSVSNNSEVQKPDCAIEGKILDGNKFRAESQGLIVSIVANTETEDVNFGESHRLLLVLNSATCQEMFRKALPVNRSPDFPYHLSQITYNNLSQAIAIRGYDKLYVFDLEKMELKGPLKPEYLNQRFSEDAQSGVISRVEVWENYLIGYALGKGAFVFDMSETANIKAVMPTAEYGIEGGISYNSLFLLKSRDESGAYQALLPEFDEQIEEFKLNPLFPHPRKISLNVNRSFRNNPYIVLNETTPSAASNPIAIDMTKKKLVELPQEIRLKKDTEIIQWMKKR